MRKLFLLILFVASVCGAYTAPPADVQEEMPAYVPGELLVKFAPGARTASTEDTRTRIRADHRASVRTLLPMTGIEVWRLPEEDMVAAARAVAADPAVLYASPNHYLRLLRVPDDPRFAEQWGLNNSGQTGGTPGADVSGPDAWNITTGTDIIVAVVDTGVNYLHPDLAANMWRNPGEVLDGTDTDGNGYIDDIFGIDAYGGTSDPMDHDGHGTHCAGIIGAVGNNAEGIVGVNWRVRIMAFNFFDARGWGEEADAIECIEYAVRHGARVINASWGGDPYNPALFDAIEMARHSNVLFVAGAGNSARDNDITPFYPSSYTNENLIAVAASDHNDLRASFSCFGSNSVHLAAPGVDILSTVLFNFYEHKNGTSMATPFVTGAAALLWSLRPDLPYSRIKDAIVQSVDSVPAFASITRSGGRLNLYNALRAIMPAVTFDRPLVAPGEKTLVTLFDPAWEGSPTATVHLVSTSGDSEHLVLYPREPGGYIFTNAILVSHGPATPDNGILETDHNTDFFGLSPDTVHGGTVTGRTTMSFALHIAVTTTPQYVAQQQQDFSLAGWNNGTVHADMLVSNTANGIAHVFTATNEWSAPAIHLVMGTNTVVVYGSNVFGFTDTVLTTLILCGPSGATHYVAHDGTHTWPFTSPTEAATSVVAAAHAAYHGNRVNIGPGVYPVRDFYLDKALHLIGTDGADNTILDAHGTGRCLTLVAPAVLENVTLRNGIAEKGGGAYLADGMLLSVTVVSNTATDLGGGVWLGTGGTLSNSLVYGNHAFRGGGVYCHFGGTATHSTIAHNFATDRGGGVYLFYATLAHTHVHNNFTTNRGGGVYVGTLSSADFCLIESNTVQQTGGGVYCRGGSLSRSILRYNHANSQGGGLLAERGSRTDNCLITHNSARIFGGGIASKFGVVHNSTIAYNYSEQVAGGIFSDPIELYNSIVYYNQAQVSDNIHITSIDAVANCTYPAIPGSPTITNPPAFRAAHSGDFRLRASSPCRNAGDNVFAFGLTDLDGQPRISEGVVDIGAYEFLLGELTCVFDATPKTGMIPLDVSFTAEAWGTNLTGLHYTWDFDANGLGMLTNTYDDTIHHTYTHEGLYSVLLTVTTDLGETATFYRTDVIDAVPEPVGIYVIGLLGFMIFRRRIATPFFHS